MGGTNKHQKTLVPHTEALKQMLSISPQRGWKLLLKMKFTLMFFSVPQLELVSPFYNQFNLDELHVRLRWKE